MSSRRSRSRQSSSEVRIDENQIAELISRLQSLVPEIRRRSSNKVTSSSRVLEETCNYIRSLQKEVDDLSDRLSQLLASPNIDTTQAALIRSLFM